MMDENSPSCECVIDTAGLHDLANATGNIKAVAVGHLKNGTIAVPTWAWQELKEVYPEEAQELEPYVVNKVFMRQTISIGAARIAEKLNSGFSRGPYDNHTGLFTAAFAAKNGYHVLTSNSELSTYAEMGCDACDLETWATELRDE